MPSKANHDMFPLPVRVLLRPHARARGISTDRLIIELITTIAEERMVDAVLDDEKAGV